MGLVWFGLVIYYFCIFSFRLCLSFQLCLQLSSLTLLSNSLCFFFFLSPFFLRACSCGQVLRTHVWFVVRSLVLVYVVFFFFLFLLLVACFCVSVLPWRLPAFVHPWCFIYIALIIMFVSLFPFPCSLSFYFSVFFVTLIQSIYIQSHTISYTYGSYLRRSVGVYGSSIKRRYGVVDEGLNGGWGWDWDGIGGEGSFLFFFFVVLFTFFTLYPSLYPLSLTHSLTLPSTQS